MASKKHAPTQSYADVESGAVRKSWHGKTRVALVYPNTYTVGMSSLGFQAVYQLLNEMEDVVCERAFLSVGKNGCALPSRSVESERPLSDFDVIAFSISFESDYLNILRVVESAGLPLRSAARGDPHPLVIAGGVACFLNPEPVAPLLDCILIGEAEGLLPRFFHETDRSLERRECLKKIARNVPGAYVPELYEPSYTPDGLLASFSPRRTIPKTVRRVYAENISETVAASSIVTPHTTFDRARLLEVSRGCPHGCRFCSAGYVYRPPRFRSLSRLMETLSEGAALSKKVGLMGAAVSDHPNIEALSKFALQEGFQLSFSSLRADALTPALIDVLRQSRVKTATIAPDAGSERMRRVINKGISENQILEAVEMIVGGGIPNLKLYFMIGLPTEEEADIRAIIDLCRLVKMRFLETSRKKKRIGTITISVNPFIPKPFTPFQWAAMEEPAVLQKKTKTIRAGLQGIANVRIQAESPRKALIQAILARGDRRTFELLEQVLKNQGNWSKTLKENSGTAAAAALRERTLEELLPWDFIDHGIRKSFLSREYRRALQGKPSPPCPLTDCTVCGVC